MGKKIMKETNIFKVLADQQRREILIMLKDGRLNAGEIAEKLQVTPAASHWCTPSLPRTLSHRWQSQ